MNTGDTVEVTTLSTVSSSSTTAHCSVLSTATLWKSCYDTTQGCGTLCEKICSALVKKWSTWARENLSTYLLSCAQLVSSCAEWEYQPTMWMTIVSEQITVPYNW